MSKPVLIDRGVDVILLFEDGKIVRIDQLSGMKLIQLLNHYGLTNIQTVSFDEYESSEKYPKAIY